MKSPNLKVMSFDDILDLRERIDDHLSKLATSIRSDLAEKIARLDRVTGKAGRGPAPSRRGRSLKGRKVPPKYRNPKNSSETWAGRGATPRWLTAFIKQGRKLNEFLIDKSAAPQKRAATKRRAKAK
jgi:DNA-binding protein H-NS